jgi:hypothetical protein
MIKSKYKFINGEGIIKPLYNKDKNIYLNFEKYKYIIRYNKYNLEIIEKSKLSEKEKEKVEKEIVIQEQKSLFIV